MLAPCPDTEAIMSGQQTRAELHWATSLLTQGSSLPAMLAT